MNSQKALLIIFIPIIIIISALFYPLGFGLLGYIVKSFILSKKGYKINSFLKRLNKFDKSLVYICEIIFLLIVNPLLFFMIGRLIAIKLYLKRLDKDKIRLLEVRANGN